MPIQTPRTLLLALLVLAAAPDLGRAQSPAGMDTLPTDPALAQLVAEALAARPELGQARAGVRADRERVPQVGALPDPTLSLGIQNDGFRSIQVGKMESSFYQVMLSQPLPWPGKRGLREEVAKRAADGAEAAVARLRLSTEAEVRRAYLALLVARERLALLDELERVWQRSIGTARARYEAGEGAQTDVMRAQLELLRLQQRRAALRAEEAQQVQALNRLRGRPLGEAIATGTTVAAFALPALHDQAAVTADAEARSPELQAARAAQQQAEAAARLARRERYPDLGVQAGVMLRGPIDPMWTASVSIGLPIWSGRKQARAVAESDARQEASALGAEAVAQVLRQRVAERQAALAAALETLRIYRQGLLVQSAATAESALAQYRVGKVTFASVLDANAGLLADQDAHLLAAADAQRLAIAAAEVSLEPAGGAGAAGGMGGGAVPGAGATASGGGMSGGGAAPAPAAAPAGGGSSSSSGM